MRLGLLLSLCFLASGFVGLPVTASYGTVGTMVDRSDGPVRIGFTLDLFRSVNPNDARGAIRVLSRTVGLAANVPMHDEPLVGDAEAMAQALREGRVDAVGMSVLEFSKLGGSERLGPLFTTRHQGSIYEEFVLITHRDGPVESLAELGDRTLVLHTDSRSNPAPYWIDARLEAEGLPRVSGLVARVVPEMSLQRAVLSVFFNQVDAGVVPRSGLDLMAEMNPQIRQQLRILETSPPLITALFALRADYNPTFKQELLQGLADLDATPAGRQMLTIFQAEGLEPLAPSVLQQTLDLLDQWMRSTP